LANLTLNRRAVIWFNIYFQAFTGRAQGNRAISPLTGLGV
jgi:hypothetical protein